MSLPKPGALVLKKAIQWGILAVLLCACIVIYMLTMLSQDLTLLEYKKAFGEIKHPQDTKLIQSFSSLGAFDKTRVMYKEDFPQGCDYRVGEIRGYSGSRENIEAFYSVQKINIGDQEKSVGIMFIPINDEGIIDPYALAREDSIEIGPSGFQILEDLRGDQYFHFLKLEPSFSYYLVSLSGFSFTDSDIRCQF
jgi:hypothetical protein